MKNVEVAETEQDQAEFLRRVEFLPFVAADQRLFQRAISDVPAAHQSKSLLDEVSLAAMASFPSDESDNALMCFATTVGGNPTARPDAYHYFWWTDSIA